MNTPKPHHWGKADARFFAAQDDVENRGWGVFEMGADIPILFWCATRGDAETAALRLNHINEQFLTCRRSQLGVGLQQPNPAQTPSRNGGGNDAHKPNERSKLLTADEYLLADPQPGGEG